VALVRTPADLGALARAARKAHSWNQQQAADAAGVSRRFVSMFESGGHANAELWRVLALLSALGVELTGFVASGTDTTAAAAEPAPPEPPAPDGFDLDAHLSAFRDEPDRS
jgi:HTH-type transcriptional regulator/antitoxin HipB